MRDFGTAPFNFYPRPPRGERPDSPCSGAGKRTDFYPRPPRGERHQTKRRLDNTHNFYPRPPRGERLAGYVTKKMYETISIHALREESDR